MEKKVVYYYRAQTPDGEYRFKDRLRKILTLPEVDREAVIIGAEMNITSYDASHDANYICCTIRLLRFVAPSKGRRGTNITAPIDLLDDEGISEKTHFMYSIDDDILAVEYNHHGPKVSHIVKLVNEIYKQNFDYRAKKCTFAVIAAHSAREVLRNSIGVRKVLFEVEHISRQDASLMPFGDALKDIAADTETQTIQVILAPEKRSRNWIMQPRQAIDKFLSGAGIAESSLSKLQMDVVDNMEHIHSIDILNDQLMKDFNVPVLTNGTREIDSAVFLKLMLDDVVSRRESHLLSERSA